MENKDFIITINNFYYVKSIEELNYNAHSRYKYILTTNKKYAQRFCQSDADFHILYLYKNYNLSTLTYKAIKIPMKKEASLEN